MAKEQDEPAEVVPAELLKQLVEQNKELLEQIQQERLEKEHYKQKLGARSDGSLAGGFQYADGQVHFHDPKLSDEKLWDKMSDEGGVLG